MKNVKVSFDVNSIQRDATRQSVLYTYKSVIDVKKNDIVVVDTKYGSALARVQAVREADDARVGDYKMILAVVDVDKLKKLNLELAVKEQASESQLVKIKKKIEAKKASIEGHTRLARRQSEILAAEENELEKLERQYKIAKGEVFATAYGADFDGIDILICRG
jgi:hypothetical protein